MILEGVINFGFFVIELAFSFFNFISLPFNLLSVLFDILRFGVWVVGADLFGLMMANIFFWYGFKFAAGLVLFVYRLLPLT